VAFVDLDKLYLSYFREAIVTLFFVASLFTQAEEADVLGVSELLHDKKLPEGTPL